MTVPLKLFIKSGCPWCDVAREWLDAQGFRYLVVDVLADRAAYDEMIHLSGQRKAPTLQAGDLVLPDFGPEELAHFVKKHSLEP
jgi:monothiol glutaredoxin